MPLPHDYHAMSIGERKLLVSLALSRFKEIKGLRGVCQFVTLQNAWPMLKNQCPRLSPGLRSNLTP